MPIPYSEQAQRACFKAARDLRAIAAEVLNDCIHDHEFLGNSGSWSKEKAAEFALQANHMEEAAWQYNRYPAPHVQRANMESRKNYNRAINAFEARWDAAKDRQKREEDKYIVDFTTL